MSIEWISVEERMPEGHSGGGYSTVMVYILDAFLSFDIAFFDSDRGWWCHGLNGQKADGITHWAELNEPAGREE